MVFFFAIGIVVVLLLIDIGWPYAAVAAICLGVIAYVFYVPLMIYLTHRQEANPTLTAVAPDALARTTICQQNLAPVQEPLVQTGFEVVDTLFVPHQVDNVRAALVLFANRATDESAMVVWMYSLVLGKWKVQMHYVEFNTHFHDGPDINTLNAKAWLGKIDGVR